MKTYLIGFFSFILFGIGYYLFCTPAGAINRHIIHYDCTSLQINKIDIYEYMIKTPCYIAIKDSDMGGGLGCPTDSTLPACNEKIVSIGPFFILQKKSIFWKVQSVGTGP